jgi:hypothetical protein
MRGPIGIVVGLLIGASVTALGFTQLGRPDVSVRDLTAPITAGLVELRVPGPDAGLSMPQAPSAVVTEPPVGQAGSATSIADGPLPKLTSDLRTELQRYQSRSIFGVEGRMPISAVRVAIRAGLAAGMTSAELTVLMSPGVTVFSDPYGGGGLLRYAAQNPDVLRQVVAYVGQEPTIRGSIWMGGYTRAVHQATLTIPALTPVYMAMAGGLAPGDFGNPDYQQAFVQPMIELAKQDNRWGQLAHQQLSAILASFSATPHQGLGPSQRANRLDPLGLAWLQQNFTP